MCRGDTWSARIICLMRGSFRISDIVTPDCSMAVSLLCGTVGSPGGQLHDVNSETNLRQCVKFCFAGLQDVIDPRSGLKVGNKT